MRILCLLAAMGAITTAFASFDLLLLPSSDGKIHRFDPANQVNLGSFGSGGSIDGTAINPVNGEIAVIRQGIASMGYNPNTGALLWASNGAGTARWLGYNETFNRYDVLADNRYLDTIQSNAYAFGPILAATPTVQNYIRYDNGSGLALGMDVSSGVLTFRRWTNGTTLVNTNTQTFAAVNFVSNLMQHEAETYLVISNPASHLFSQIVNGLSLIHI